MLRTSSGEGALSGAAEPLDDPLFLHPTVQSASGAASAKIANLFRPAFMIFNAPRPAEPGQCDIRFGFPTSQKSDTRAAPGSAPVQAAAHRRERHWLNRRL